MAANEIQKLTNVDLPGKCRILFRGENQVASWKKLSHGYVRCGSFERIEARECGQYRTRTDPAGFDNLESGEFEADRADTEGGSVAATRSKLVVWLAANVAESMSSTWILPIPSSVRCEACSWPASQTSFSQVKAATARSCRLTNHDGASKCTQYILRRSSTFCPRPALTRRPRSSTMHTASW